MNILIRRIIIPGIIIAIAFFGMQRLSSMKKEQKRQKPKQVIRAVQAEVVTPKLIQPTITAMGRVRSREVIQLTPEVNGIIETKNFRLRKGDTFKKGTVLARIDSRLAENSYRSMISDLQNALVLLLPELKSEMPQAFIRWNTFFSTLSHDKNLPKLPTVSESREKYFVSRFNVFKLYYMAKNQEVTLIKHTLLAPFTGAVSNSTVFPSSMVKAGVALASLVRTDKLEIELPLSVSEIAFVKKGMPVTIQSDVTKDNFTGKIHRIGKSLDDRMQTQSVFVRLHSSSSTLLDGTFVTASIIGLALPNAVVLDRKAVHQKNKVFTIDQGILIEKSVVVAYSGINTSYITEGLDPQDTLVTEVLQDAVAGMDVRPLINGKVVGASYEESAPPSSKLKGKRKKG